MSGRFPGAPDLEGFWQMLSEWRDCIGEVPEDRWRWRDYWGDEPGRTRVKEAGFIEGLAEFDPLLFGISPAEALLMDPQQRLFLTHAWAAIEDAGYAPSSLAGGDTAIFVGTAPSGYAKRIEQADVAIDGYSSTGSVASVGPSRLSYLLDLHGPSEPVETACSSALVAVHRAVEAIRHGRCETALAGGVNAIVLPEVHVAFDKAGMLSPDGRCKTFSARADGYGRGEGVGILFLKELAAAERDGDPIHAVIRGSAVNHGGRAGSLTAPNPRAQASLIEAAVRDAGVEPSQIGYVETHGTGTALGDPIEIEGLTAAFRALHAEAGTAFETAPRCALGSVKSNIGHLELAAGAAGLIKAVLQLKHGHLVRSLHCEDLNPYIRLEGTPFEIAREDRSWPAPRDVENRPLLRVAGVSSFGFGGVNAHVVLEEYPEPERSAAEASEGEPVVVVLSARDGERLAEAAHNLLAVIRREHRPCLRDLAYTLQLGRQAFAERLAFEAASYEALQDTLGRFLADGAAPGLHRGRARHDSRARALFDGDEALAETLRGWLARRKTAKLMALWVEGIDVDWAALHDGEPSRRVRLPTYPFARERYWIVPPAGAGEANNKVVRLTAAQPARAAGEEDFHGALLDRLIAEELSAEEAIRLIRERPA